MAEVEASLDIPTRTLRFVLRAVDPATGWYPEDPMVGVRYPNDSSGRGQGSIGYLVKPLSGLATGVVITNQARICFDYKDPIATPVASNTIDAGAPASSVVPLPAEVGRTFLVRWGGQDDAGGSGLAKYDVFDSTNGNDFGLWLKETTDTSAWYVGERGGAYAFYAIARDYVGNVEAAPLVADAQTTVPTNTPLLAVIAGQEASPNSRLVFTNQGAGGSGAGFLFMTDHNAPVGAGVNPTNGVFTWTPTCAQASRTNQITLWVVDRANTNLMDATTFTVAVGRCVVPGLGRVVLETGESGRVPVNLISSVPLTNLSMTVEVQPALLTNLTLEPIVPEICAATLTPLLIGSSSGRKSAPSTPEKDRSRLTLAVTDAGTGSLHLLSLTTCSNQFLIGMQQIAWLHFQALSNHPSAFVTLQLDNTVGLQPNGVEIRNFAPQAGRVVVVGEEPLLEAFFETHHLPALILYAKTGTTNVVIASPDLSAPAAAWTSVQSIGVSNLFQWVQLPATNQWMFYRAVRQ